MTPQIKTCFKCGRTLALSEFYKHQGMADGHMGKCKECARADVKENRKEKIVYYKQYDRKRAMRPDRVAARKEYEQKEERKKRRAAKLLEDRKQHPQKNKARYLVANGIRQGTLRKQPCLICGETDSVQAHHEDYSKPLDVMWLCPKHHKWIHS